jgi:hypothetical protein
VQDPRVEEYSGAIKYSCKKYLNKNISIKNNIINLFRCTGDPHPCKGQPLISDPRI